MPAVMAEPATRKFTPDDLLLLPDRGKRVELVDGEFKELNASFLSTYVAGEVYGHLRDHVRPLRLGWVSPEGTSYRCFPNDPKRVRRTDTAFHRLDRLTVEQVQFEGYCTVVPDLVVEVVSHNDLGYEIEEKRNEWLEAGAKLVWEVYSDSQTVYAYHADGSGRHYSKNDTLTGEPVLPQFQAPVAEFLRFPTSAVTPQS